MKIDLRGNAVAATLEQVAVGASFLIFYGQLIRAVGADLLGVLSLVLILTSVGSMANAGFGSAASRFVPLFEGRGDRASTLRCIETTVVGTCLLYGASLALAYWPFQTIISAQAGPEHAGLVVELMGPAAVYVLLMGAGSTTTSALTALQRSDLRAWANLAGVAACLAVLFLAVPRFGIVAGMWALCAQAGVVLVVTWVQLRHVLPELAALPLRVDPAMMRQMLSLGMNLQIQSLLAAGLEPVARLFVGQFGSLVDVAYFSMASRFVVQVRALVFAASQPLLSAFSYLGQTNVSALAALHVRVNAIIGFGTLLSLSAAAGASPFVGEVWIGERQDIFVIFSILLTIGWAFNTAALSSYFMAYSQGHMRWNMIAHVVMFAINLALGPILGLVWGASGVAVAVAVALAISGLIMGVGNGRLIAEARTPPSLHLWLGMWALIAAVLAVATYFMLRPMAPPLLSGLASGGIWLAVIIPPAFFHPVGQNLVNALREVRAN